MRTSLSALVLLAICAGTAAWACEPGAGGKSGGMMAGMKPNAGAFRPAMPMVAYAPPMLSMPNLVAIQQQQLAAQAAARREQFRPQRLARAQALRQQEIAQREKFRAEMLAKRNARANAPLTLLAAN